MTSLIDDLLDVSRVSRGLVTIEQIVFDARLVIASAVEQVRPLIDSRRHMLTVRTPPESAFLQGDQKRLIQVLTNLMNNAAKYTPEGGSIELTMELDKQVIRIRVADNGIGLHSSMVPHVFELFTQAERTSDRSQGGLGIGLALVKSLVELHDGTVEVHSDGLGHGSHFSVNLPRVAAPENVKAENTDVNARAKRGKRLLIVDDNLDAAEMLGTYLEIAGHDVVIKHDAQSALQLVKTKTPDICLLDIGLPDMDGNELARNLRSMPETSATLLIAITGYGQEQDRRNSKDAGFHHHLVKPVDMDKLVGMLNDL